MQESSGINLFVVRHFKLREVHSTTMVPEQRRVTSMTLNRRCQITCSRQPASPPQLLHLHQPSSTMRSLVVLMFICMLLPKAAVGERSCYLCDPRNCQRFTRQICPAGADSCLTATATVGTSKFTFKTCAPKLVCDMAQLSGVSLENVKCCQTNLCNGAEIFTQSFLLMFVPLISSLLFF
ncbi:ly-6/neurotoxin-like protein 1 isoform X1 [Tachysurus fulvidraco]|uniref:ly-6/neurotoxin-like protein 1 isoform X1 n=1 Tax=Tachysurus fulvidraco TaxID=1234273 RepID=UPI001FEF895E|nr:ly-6/neurotoxin-like protein 1 isoform X1 [Tachysurus fulvidraco]